MKILNLEFAVYQAELTQIHLAHDHIVLCLQSAPHTNLHGAWCDKFSLLANDASGPYYS
ncbi:hypothetical protein KDK_22380 [Dictyobacter kobayashii]|uniref:Uncharacterized protein n=1 Tax=Dictyobacter kobayashii TaxID=2014872 RepID=A0A402AH47_9CHLR|nr:hypothetical protein KDK_22380 [Dictyobacter kobayashii]